MVAQPPDGDRRERLTLPAMAFRCRDGFLSRRKASLSRTIASMLATPQTARLDWRRGGRQRGDRWTSAPPWMRSPGRARSARAHRRRLDHAPRGGRCREPPSFATTETVGHREIAERRTLPSPTETDTRGIKEKTGRLATGSIRAAKGGKSRRGAIAAVVRGHGAEHPCSARTSRASTVLEVEPLPDPKRPSHTRAVTVTVIAHPCAMTCPRARISQTVAQALPGTDQDVPQVPFDRHTLYALGAARRPSRHPRYPKDL